MARQVVEPSDEGRLARRVALVTGADSGIGKAIAELFAREGADVAVTYHTDEEGAHDTVRKVEAQGGRALVAQLDQKDHDAVRRLFERVERELAVPDILVNNAAVNFLGKPFHELTPEDWDLVVRTDLYGPFYCAREFVLARDRAGRKGGAIVNVTSVHEDAPIPGGSAYDASKGGLRNLTRTLALDLAERGIRVNNLAPGMILTPMNLEALEDPEKRREAERSIPMRRAGEPEEVARAALFLASDEAAYVHGTTLVVDGGLLLQMGQGA